MENTTPAYPFADLSLARRLEKAEAVANADFVMGRLLAFPESKAESIQIGGTQAMFDGPDSPLTQTFGLGMFAEVTEQDFNSIEQFFQSRGAEVFHEVCPLAHGTAFSLLSERAYRAIEFSNVLYRPVSPDAFASSRSSSDAIVVRRTRREEQDLWTRIATEGWSEFTGLGDFMEEMGKIMAKRDALTFIAESDGHPIATGAMTICEGVVLLAGASTIPSARRKGAQLALLNARLRYAAEHSCDIAMMAALPGSASQRNAERNGFRIAYTRTKWHLPSTKSTLS